MISKTPLEMIAATGLTADEFFNRLIHLTNASPAVTAARKARRRGDWDAYEKACEGMTDAELERECSPPTTPNHTARR